MTIVTGTPPGRRWTRRLPGRRRLKPGIGQVLLVGAGAGLFAGLLATWTAERGRWFEPTLAPSPPTTAQSVELAEILDELTMSLASDPAFRDEVAEQLKELARAGGSGEGAAVPNEVGADGQGPTLKLVTADLVTGSGDCPDAAEPALPIVTFDYEDAGGDAFSVSGTIEVNVVVRDVAGTVLVSERLNAEPGSGATDSKGRALLLLSDCVAADATTVYSIELTAFDRSGAPGPQLAVAATRP